jgi:hypothetical protein
MNKKEESVLGLVPLESPPALSMVGAQTFIDGNHALTQREVIIIENLHEQELVIDAVTSKTIFGMQKLDEIKLYAVSEFLETAAYIDGTKRQALGTDYQAAVGEFCTYLTRLSAHHLLGAVEVSAATIGEEIRRSIYPPPEPAESPRRGLLQRLFGG